LNGIPIFIGAGRQDLIVPRDNALELAEIFRLGGADVTVHWHSGGHQLGLDDFEEAKRWLTRHF
jgi:phospholipase/carboxylesterase